MDVVEGEDAYFHTDWSNKVDAWPEDQFLEQSSVAAFVDMCSAALVFYSFGPFDSLHRRACIEWKNLQRRYLRLTQKILEHARVHQ